jgi:hypothetical protein
MFERRLQPTEICVHHPPEAEMVPQIPANVDPSLLFHHIAQENL